jgi:hypothetical protein
VPRWSPARDRLSIPGRSTGLSCFAIASREHDVAHVRVGDFVETEYGMEIHVRRSSAPGLQRTAGDGRFTEPGHRQTVATGSGQHRQDQPSDPGPT